MKVYIYGGLYCNLDNWDNLWNSDGIMNMNVWEFL